MLFVVCGADCDHVGDIYECPQGTYAIGLSSSTTKQFHIHKNTNNKDICNTNNKLFMILYNCNFMMYCMRFHTGFLFGREGGGAPSVLRQVQHLLLHQWKTCSCASCCLICFLFTIPSSESLFTIGSVTAYTSGPSSTFW